MPRPQAKVTGPHSPRLSSVPAIQRLAKKLSPRRRRKPSLPGNAAKYPPPAQATSPNITVADIRAAPPTDSLAAATATPRKKRSTLSAISSAKAIVTGRRKSSVTSDITSTLHAAAVTTAGAIEALSTRAPTRLLPPEARVISSDVELFGSAIPAKFYKTLGGQANSATTYAATAIEELVLLQRDVLLQELLGGLQGTALGEVKLSAARLIYGAESKGEEPRVAISASVDFSGPLSQVGQVLEDLLGVGKTTLEVKGFLGKTLDWKTPLDPDTLVLRGMMLGKAKGGRGKAGFTKAVMELKIAKEQEGYSAVLELSGDVVMALPGGAVKMEWTMKEESPGTWTLKVADKEIGDVVGFKGLKLVDLEFTARFPTGQAVSDLDFELCAGMEFGTRSLLLGGGYGKELYLETEVPHCTMEDIRELYTFTTGRELEAFHHSAEFHNIRFRVDQAGLKFTGEVVVDGHRSIEATVAVRRDGLAITGSLLDMQLGAVKIEKAELDIFVGRTAGNETSRPSGFAINGQVSFRNLKIDVAAYTTLTEHEGVQWAIYGEVGVAEMKLHRLAPDVKGSWLDLGLKQVAFIASSSDSPQGGSYNVFGYPIRKGVQFCAAIDGRLEPLDHVTKQEMHGLVLRAAWSPDQGFRFGVVLPTPVGIHLTKNVTSGPVELELVASRMPQLQFTATLHLTSSRQPQPLVFTFGLKADLASAKGFGQMTNYWHNPFGIGERVRIGPNLALEVGITYAVLAATGTPSSIGLSGGMAIGDAEAQVAMKVSENPADELLQASLTELSIQNIVKFASHLSGQDIPAPPEDLLGFRDVELYLSAGTSVGTTYYPAGASFKGQMDLFGQTSKLEFSIGNTIRIAGQFEKLQVGPLTVCGADGRHASAVVELGVQKQHIRIDGRVRLFGFEASIDAKLDILPVPNMELELSLALADALRLTLGATVVGAVDFRTLHKADFMVHAILEQDVVEYLVQQIRYCLEALSRFLADGIEAAHSFIEDAQSEIENAIADTFDEAKRSWDENRAALRAAWEEAQGDFDDTLRSLEDDLFGTRKEVEDAVFAAQKQLEKARIQSATIVSSATAELQKKKVELEREAKAQLQDIRQVKEKVKSIFGGAVEQKLRDAEQKVGRAQGNLDACNLAYIAALESAHFYSGMSHHLKVHRLKHVRNDAQAELATQQALLKRARAAAESPEYAALRSAKAEKKAKLRRARNLRGMALQEAEAHLAADAAAQEAVVRQRELEARSAEARTDEITNKARELQEFRAANLPRVAELRSQAQASEEAQPKSPTLEKLRARRLDGSAAKVVVDRYGDSVGADDVYKTFDIERVELRGSLRALVLQGRPLQAKIAVVVMGSRRELVCDWGAVDVVGFVDGVLRGLWSPESNGSGGE